MSKTKSGITRRKRFIVLVNHGPCCHYCGQSLRYDSITLDHRTPRVRGGTNHVTNLVPACKQCNCWKACLTEAEYWPVAKDHTARKALIARIQAEMAPS